MSSARNLCLTLGLFGTACTDKADTDSTDTEESDVPPGVSTFNLLGAEIPGGYYLSAWSDGDTALLAGGDIGLHSGSIARYDGDSLCVEEDVADGVLWWIHGRAPGQWYAVGESGIVVHSVDGVRTREDLDTEITLYGLFDDGTDVWAVGGRGLEGGGEEGQIWRKQGESWALHTDEVPGVVYKVWNGWVVGNGFAGRLTETGLDLVDLGVDDRLLTVRGASADDVWVVGGLATPVLLHHVDDTTTPVALDPFCASQGLNGVWTAAGEPVAIAGNNGATAMLNTDGTFDCPSFPVSFDHFHAAWKHGDEFLFIGGNLFSSSDNHGALVSFGPQKDTLTATTCED
jgi:hypothetical protein